MPWWCQTKVQFSDTHKSNQNVLLAFIVPKPSIVIVGCLEVWSEPMRVKPFWQSLGSSRQGFFQHGKASSCHHLSRGKLIHSITKGENDERVGSRGTASWRAVVTVSESFIKRQLIFSNQNQRICSLVKMQSSRSPTSYLLIIASNTSKLHETYYRKNNVKGSHLSFLFWDSISIQRSAAKCSPGGTASLLL